MRHGRHPPTPSQVKRPIAIAHASLQVSVVIVHGRQQTVPVRQQMLRATGQALPANTECGGAAALCVTSA